MTALRFVTALLMLGTGTSAMAQAPHSHQAEGVPGRCEAPASENQGKPGCYFNASVEIGALPKIAFWHIDEFRSAKSAQAARRPGGVVVEAYGRVFLQTVNGERRWRAAGGKRLASIGPFPVPDAPSHTARFMEAMTAPGATTRPHLHPGPEGFYVLDGAMCLETPEGTVAVGARQGRWVRGDLPMRLSSTGTSVRRSLVFVLHPTGEPWMTATEWKPQDLCARAAAKQ